MDIDSSAHKDSIYSFEAVARRAGSECDPVFRLLDAKGAVVTEVDDSPGMGKDAADRMEGPGGRNLHGTDRRSPRSWR